MQTFSPNITSHPVGAVLRRKAQRKVSTRAFLLHARAFLTTSISEHGRRGFPTSPDTLHTILQSSVPLGRYVYRNVLPSHLEPRRGGICVENRCFNLFSPVGVTSTISEHGRRGSQPRRIPYTPSFTPQSRRNDMFIETHSLPILSPVGAASV